MLSEEGRGKFVVANWKANMSLSQGEKWLDKFGAGYRPAPWIRLVIAVPSLFLVPLQQKYGSLQGVSWAAQDVSPYPPGRYTGAVPAAWLGGLVDYVLVGHRERRKYFHETIQEVANKSSEALAEDIQPILCVDLDTASPQAAAITFEEIEHLVVAFTPAEADRLEIARGQSSVADGVRRVGAHFPGCPVLYGGGVNEGNVALLISQPEVSGVMVAAGCLDPHSFTVLLSKAAAALMR